jgi:hypothetical protein
MRKGIFFLYLVVLATTTGRVSGQIIDPAIWPHPGDTYSPVFPIPAKEAFLNEILPLVVDSSFTCYYMGADAGRCEFVKYNIDEWEKYGLEEQISIVTLNELSEKCYRDSIPSTWQQDSLLKADCIDGQTAWLIMHPTARLTSETPGRGPARKAYRQLRREWAKQPRQEHMVYWFSKPEFTDDGQYAVMTAYNDCGNGCASSFIYLFRHGAAGWKRIGSMLDWQS